MLARENDLMPASRNLFGGFVLLLIAGTIAVAQPATCSARAQLTKIVVQIQRADYEGDRAALQRLQAEITPFADSKDFGSRARYWRGFALWRRAINGFNEEVGLDELQDDLQKGLDEFDAASRQDPTFTDAKVGSLGCLSLIGFVIFQKHPDRKYGADFPEVWARFTQLRKEIEDSAPDNPRLLWILGPSVWKTPPERGGGEAKAFAMYNTGLEAIRNHKTTNTDALEPSWGEPELLMNLAWSELNRASPDLNRAEDYGRSALQLVPYWHYVRDILMPQIQAAKKKQGATL
jgi:hypothetical protein